MFIVSEELCRQFVPILGYEGFYEISPEGIIKSLPRVVCLKNGKRVKYKGGVVSQRKNSNGYMYATLCKGGVRKHYGVHRLLAKMFIPNPDNKQEVNHINGVRHDNRLCNLEWVSHTENIQHAYSVLKTKPSMLGKYGKDHNRSKIILQIKDGKIIAEFYGFYEAKRKTGVNVSNICSCCKGNRREAGGFHWEYKKNN